MLGVSNPGHGAVPLILNSLVAALRGGENTSLSGAADGSYMEIGVDLSQVLSLATAAATYATLAEIGTLLSISTAASTYVSNTALATSLASYLTSATAATTYVSNASLATSLAKYLTLSLIHI